MSDGVRWRRVYGKPTAFVGGIECGDCYRSNGAEEGDVWRVRWWNPSRPDARRLRYVLAPEGGDGEAFAKEALVALLEEGVKGEREG